MMNSNQINVIALNNADLIFPLGKMLETSHMIDQHLCIYIYLFIYLFIYIYIYIYMKLQQTH